MYTLIKIREKQEEGGSESSQPLISCASINDAQMINRDKGKGGLL
jgi:hypothetical protein